MRGPFFRRDWLGLWILWSAWCSWSGWTLSALGLLSRAGYAVTTLLFITLAFAGRHWILARTVRPLWLWRRSTYAGQWLPLLWLGGTLMVIVGGLLYRPTDYDYLTYRFPRLLHWWWAHRWMWIDTTDERQNISATGMEWLMAPIFFLFRTDRLFPLINIISFLFLPGLIFSVLRRMGVGRRMAWNWMWLLPFGYCFVLQAGSMANDAFAAVPFLAALYYAGQARPGAPWAAVLSIVAIALPTGDKLSNVPLVVPWLAVVWSNREDFFASARPALLVAACAAALACSFVPMGLLNIVHTGSYTGDPMNIGRSIVQSPVAGVVGNGLETLAGAFAPPFWPHPINFNFLSPASVAAVKEGFPRFELDTVPIQLEDNAGIGLGVTIMAAAAILAGVAARLRGRAPVLSRGAGLFALATMVALGAYMLKVGTESAQRLLTVYYVAGLLALLRLFPENGDWPRSMAWRALAGLSMLLVLPMLMLNPARPIVPAHMMGHLLRAGHVPASAVAQLENNDSLRFARLDLYRSIRLAVPPSERQLEVVETEDDPETSLWLPFGSHEVVRAHPERPGSLAGHYVAVNSEFLRDNDHLTIDQLMEQNSLQVVRQQDVTNKTNHSATWYLLAPAQPPVTGQLPPPAGAKRLP